MSGSPERKAQNVTAPNRQETADGRVTDTPGPGWTPAPAAPAPQEGPGRRRLPPAPKRVKETPEYADMVRRILRAYGRRVAAGNLEDLGPMREIIDAAEHDLAAAVRGLREDQHYSWADIGRGLGMTKQAAWARFRE
jgi:hypothetical protein